MIVLTEFLRRYGSILLIVLGLVLITASYVSTRIQLNDTRNRLDVATTTITTLTEKYNELADTVGKREALMNEYYASLTALEQNFRNTQSLLNNLKSQESLAAKNPKEYTAKLQKLYNDSEREFSCLTGNLQYCSAP